MDNSEDVRIEAKNSTRKSIPIHPMLESMFFASSHYRTWLGLNAVCAPPSYAAALITTFVFASNCQTNLLFFVILSFSLQTAFCVLDSVYDIDDKRFFFLLSHIGLSPWRNGVWDVGHVCNSSLRRVTISENGSHHLDVTNQFTVGR